MRNKHLLFNEIVSELLLQSNPLDYENQPYIELLCKPTFSNDFFLQITWSKDIIHWYRSTWLKDKDRQTTAHWFDESQSDNWQLSLSILQEKGSHNHLIIKDLLTKINKLAIPPFFENNLQGRDGEEIQLTIGGNDTELNFAWRTASTPETWTPLDEVLEEILKINQTLQTTDSQSFTITYELEENQNSWEKLVSINKIK